MNKKRVAGPGLRPGPGGAGKPSIVRLAGTVLPFASWRYRASALALHHFAAVFVNAAMVHSASKKWRSVEPAWSTSRVVGPVKRVLVLDREQP